MSKERVLHLIAIMQDRNELVRDDCGEWVYFQSIAGSLTSWELRVIADHLDGLNGKDGGVEDGHP